MNVNKENIKKWVKALRSGEYNQNKGKLQNEDGFCCLGVACDLFIPKVKQDIDRGYIYGDFPKDQPNAPVWLKTINGDFRELTGVRLSELNDESEATIWEEDGYPTFKWKKRLTFDELADLLEAVYIHGVMK